MVADDLDRVLVGADCTVGTETPELAADSAFRDDVDFLAVGDRMMADIVIDTDCVMVGRRDRLHICVHCNDLSRCRILAGETEAACVAGDAGICVIQHCADFLIKRLADSAGFLVAVKNCDCLDCLRKGFKEML